MSKPRREPRSLRDCCGVTLLKPSFKVALISTGGTIEKTYDEHEGILANGTSVLEMMLGALQLDGVDITSIPLLDKDSRDMSDEDHRVIAETVHECSKEYDGVVVIHGTDTLSVTGERIVEMFPELPIPCVITGAMRPWIMRNTDALQNLVESFSVVKLLGAGVYVAMHNRVLQFPGVVKDTKHLRFIQKES
jgi:L-asparaginase